MFHHFIFIFFLIKYVLCDDNLKVGGAGKDFLGKIHSWAVLFGVFEFGKLYFQW